MNNFLILKDYCNVIYKPNYISNISTRSQGQAGPLVMHHCHLWWHRAKILPSLRDAKLGNFIDMSDFHTLVILEVLADLKIRTQF